MNAFTMNVVRALLLILTLMVWLPWAQAQTDMDGLTFVPPAGWTANAEGDGVLYTAPTPDGAVIIIFPELNGLSDPASWLENLAARQMEGKRLISQEAVQTQQVSATTTLSLKTVTVQGEDGPLVKVMALLNTPESAALITLLAGNEAAAQRHLPTFTALLSSVRFPPAQGGAAGSGRGGALGLGTAQPLPDVKSMNAAQFKASGGNPETQLIPDEFRCYRTRSGDSLTPELRVQVLAGGQYRTPFGNGTLKIVKDGSLLKLQGAGGPLNKASGYFDFDQYGQSFKLNDVGEDELDFECYQRGPRENYTLFEFKLNTPKPGDYPCTLTDGTGKSGGTLSILAGNRYRLGGQQGTFSVDFRSDQDGGDSDLEFTGGPLDDRLGRYSENEYGLREVRVSAKDLSCRVLVKPTPWPSIYGAAKAPTPPKGSGGLSGNWVHSRAGQLIPGLQLGPDFTSTMVLNSECPGNMCWEFLFFSKDGYVYTNEPDVGLEETNCTRTHPNGLPRCEVYRVQGNTIQIGTDKPLAFTIKGDSLTIGSRQFDRLLPLSGTSLSGAYESLVVTNAVVAIGGTTSRANLLFDQRGQFSFDRNSSTSMAGTGYSVYVGNKDATAGGTYKFAGNTIEFKYQDGRVIRMFAAIPLDSKGKLMLTLLRLGGVTYYLDDGK